MNCRFTKDLPGKKSCKECVIYWRQKWWIEGIHTS